MVSPLVDTLYFDYLNLLILYCLKNACLANQGRNSWRLRRAHPPAGLRLHRVSWRSTTRPQRANNITVHRGSVDSSAASHLRLPGLLRRLLVPRE